MARLVEVVRGVHEVAGLAAGRVYLIDGGDGLTLVDTNNAGRAGDILAALEGSGRRVDDVKHIIVTHWHRDHTGSLAALGERTSARVYAGARDAPFIRGDREPPPFRRAGLLGLFVPFMGRARRFEHSAVHQELREGDELDIGGGMRVVETPGHTPGQISLLLPGRGLLFTGDAYFNWPGLRLGFAVSTHDPEQAKASIRKLAALDFDAACFGHGPPVTSGARDAISRFAERLR